MSAKFLYLMFLSVFVVSCVSYAETSVVADEIRGRVTFDTSCDSNRISMISQGAVMARIVTNSAAFQQCVSLALLGGGTFGETSVPAYQSWV